MNHIRKHPYTYSMLLVVTLATLFRLLLITFHWPATNSDEGNMGIVGYQVAFNNEWPIFFYGLPYMGPVEGYLAAPLFKLFGSSLFLLRLPLVLLYAGFQIGTFYLIRLLYNERYALATVILLNLGSPEIISRQLKAVGEYPEMAIGAAFIPLIAAWLAMTSHTFLSVERTTQEKMKRASLFAVLGLILGVSVWIDFLIAPFVLTAGLMLLIFCRREKLGWAAVIIGGIIGVFPLLYYNVTAPITENSLVVLSWLHGAGKEEMVHKGLNDLHKVIGTVMIALPLQTGAYPRPDDSTWPIFGQPTTTSIINAIYYTIWGLTFITLLLVGTYRVIRKLLPQRKLAFTQAFKDDEQKHFLFVRDCARLMLLLSGVLTLLQYITSSHGAVYPITSARYLTCLVNLLPVVLWPVWQSATHIKQTLATRQRLQSIASIAMLVFIFVIYMYGTVVTVAEVPRTYNAYQQRDQLVNKLISIGATRIYSEYWTCNNLTFHSQERVICSALEPNLKPGFDRYAPYRDKVKNADKQAYVFPKTAPQLQPLAKELQGKPYERLEFDNYVIYYTK